MWMYFPCRVWWVMQGRGGLLVLMAMRWELLSSSRCFQLSSYLSYTLHLYLQFYFSLLRLLRLGLPSCHLSSLISHYVYKCTVVSWFPHKFTQIHKLIRCDCFVYVKAFYHHFQNVYLMQKHKQNINLSYQVTFFLRKILHSVGITDNWQKLLLSIKAYNFISRSHNIQL